MSDIFLYGPLRHAPLLSRVLGREAACEPAVLRDHAALLSDGKGMPTAVLTANRGAVVEGLLLRDASREDMARIAFHEGALRRLPVQAGGESLTATVPAQAAKASRSAERFDLSAWESRWATMACIAADDIMQRHGNADPSEIARLRPFIAARAWARQMGGQGAPHELRTGRGLDKVEIVRDRHGFDGFFRLRAFDMRHERFDGSWSETFSREGFVAYDAALVLPYDPQTDRVLLIEQLRYGPILRGDPFPVTLEPPAGLVDAGEAPEDTARREAEEEADITLSRLLPMVKVYASPGYSSEFFHCFLGLCSLSMDDNGVSGLDEEHEDIKSHVVSFDRAMELVDSGEVNAGPLVMMLLWLARHREELRAGA